MATNNAANNVTAATGKVLQGAGVGVASNFSTATYPSVATGTGTILRADGTNWVASTATYPDTAGTSGNVLTSDGTNWTSAAATGGGLLTATGTLTSAQVKSLRASPVQLIPAPGVGSYILIITISSKLNYGGTNAFTNPGGGTLSTAYGTFTTGTPLLITSVTLIGTSTSTFYAAGGHSTAVSTTYDNVALNAYNTNPTEFAGNAANNNTVSYSILYKIVTI